MNFCFGGAAHSIGRNQRYERALESEGYAWYVLLPQGKHGSCFGRMYKYVGFIAIESMVETDNTSAIVVRESGTLGWMADKHPRRVFVDCVDVTENVHQQDFLYTLSLPERPQKAVLSIFW